MESSEEADLFLKSIGFTEEEIQEEEQGDLDPVPSGEIQEEYRSQSGTQRETLPIPQSNPAYVANVPSDLLTDKPPEPTVTKDPRSGIFWAYLVICFFSIFAQYLILRSSRINKYAKDILPDASLVWTFGSLKNILLTLSIYHTYTLYGESILNKINIIYAVILILYLLWTLFLFYFVNLNGALYLSIILNIFLLFSLYWVGTDNIILFVTLLFYLLPSLYVTYLSVRMIQENPQLIEELPRGLPQ